MEEQLTEIRNEFDVFLAMAMFNTLFNNHNRTAKYMESAEITKQTLIDINKTINNPKIKFMIDSMRTDILSTQEEIKRIKNEKTTY